MARIGPSYRTAGELAARTGKLALRDGAIGWAVAELTQAMRLQDSEAPPPVDLVADLVCAWWQAGQLDRALDLVDRLGPALDPRGRAHLHLELAWGCLDSGRIEQARLQLAQARSLVVGTNAGLLSLHCEAIAARLTSGPVERRARAAAEAAERLADRATEPAERRAAAEVACRAWSALLPARQRDGHRLRRRILALAERHRLSGWALSERESAAIRQCWADGDDLPLRVLQDEAQRLGQVVLALRLQTRRWEHEVLVSPGSLAPALAAAAACAEQARRLGVDRVHRHAVAVLLLAAGLRADHRAWAGTLARYRASSFAALSAPASDARAWLLVLEGRDGEALDTLRNSAPPGTHAHGLLLLLGALAGTIPARQLGQPAPVRWTRQFAHWAAAVHAGRLGDRAAAERHAALAAEAAEIFPVARHLAARLVAPAAAADGWGTPVEELRAAEAWFHEQGVPAAARTCRDLLRSLGAPIQQRRDGTKAIPAELRAAGLTAREYEVGVLVCEHLGNRDIGRRLHISHRTVEKHTAALQAKLAVPSRRALIDRITSTQQLAKMEGDPPSIFNI